VPESLLSTPAVPLTTAEFHDRVHALSPSVAVFDCDGTLWSGDAGSAFMRWSMETHLLDASQTAWLNRRYEGYKRGEVSELAICGEMVQVYRGLPVATLRHAAAEFFHLHVEPNIFPEMLQLVTDLQRDGVDIWAVSSTCDWVIEAGVRRFHIPTRRVLAARVQCIDDCVTDNLLDVPTDEGKVAALRRAGILAPDVVFGNSVHDAAMLALARGHNGSGGAFAVNPTPDLLRHSLVAGWPVYFPASVAP
jgi:phosphoserine phosphatase